MKRYLGIILLLLPLTAIGSVTLAHDDVGAIPEARGHLGPMAGRPGMCKFDMCFTHCSAMAGGPGGGFQNLCALRCSRRGCT